MPAEKSLYQKALEESAARELARRHMAHFVMYTMPSYQMGWVHHEICNELDAFLEAIARKESPRLMIKMPPRSGKSELASRKFPAFVFGRHPDMSIISTSYSADLSSRMNRDVQRILESEAYAKLFPKTTLWGKNVRTISGAYQRNSDLFEIVGYQGSYRSAGIGGGITGMGMECVEESAKVLTPNGYVSISGMVAGSPIIGYNHLTKQMEVCTVEAVRVKYEKSVYRLHSNKGRSLRVTRNHPIYSGRAYINAEALAEGSPLLCAVRERVYSHGLRVQEACEQGIYARLLLKAMFSGIRAAKRRIVTQVRKVRRSLPEGQQILPGMPSYCTESAAHIPGDNTGRVQDVRGAIHGETTIRQKIRRFLFPRVPEQFSLFGNERGIEHQVQGGNGRETGPSPCQISNIQGKEKGKGIIQRVLTLWKGGKAPYPPCGFRPVQQYPEQCDCAVRVMPYRSTQARGAWGVRDEFLVSNTRESRQEGYTVIDLQVSKCHNFFANGVLVHNCGIIDDFCRNRADADSSTLREKTFDWYTSSFYTRLAPGGGILVIATSWHMDDLMGRLLEAERTGEGDAWKVISYPAIATRDEDKRKAGEALHPDRYPLEQLEKIKSALGSRDWEALYQQNPVPDGGAIFMRDWIQHYLPKDLPAKFDKTLISWDMAFKDNEDSDFVVGQVWGRKAAQYFLLDQVRGRMGFTATLEAFKRLAEKWPQATEKLVEDKANGPAVIDSLKRYVSGIIPINPDGSKSARAHAITPLFEAQNVFLPDVSIAPWIRDYEAELLQFPASAHDDQVDATTQALRRLMTRPGMNFNAANLRRR